MNPDAGAEFGGEHCQQRGLGVSGGDFREHRTGTGTTEVIAFGQELIARSTNADELLADFLHALPVGSKREGRRRKDEQKD